MTKRTSAEICYLESYATVTLLRLCPILILILTLQLLPRPIEAQGLLQQWAQSIRTHQEEKSSRGCTLRISDEAIWHDDGWLMDYLMEQGYWNSHRLTPELHVTPGAVKIGLAMEDNSYIYLGESYSFTPDGKLADYGYVTDNTVRGIVDSMLPELFWPGLNRHTYPVEPLLGPLEISISVKTMASMDEMGNLARAFTYDGELMPYHNPQGQLQIPVNINGRDTMAVLVAGQRLTEFDIVALKTFTLQERFKTALSEWFGEEIHLPCPDKWRATGKGDVIWHTHTISTGHDRLDAFMVIQFNLHFLRGAREDTSKRQRDRDLDSSYEKFL
jgi:hypothetical protein